MLLYIAAYISRYSLSLFSETVFYLSNKMGGGGGFEALQLYLFVLKRDKGVEYKNHQVLSLVVFLRVPLTARET